MMLSAMWILCARAGITMSIVMISTDVLHINMRKEDSTLSRKFLVPQIEAAGFDLVEHEIMDMMKEIREGK
jgi:hypothetical protein